MIIYRLLNIFQEILECVEVNVYLDQLGECLDPFSPSGVIILRDLFVLLLIR